MPSSTRSFHGFPLQSGVLDSGCPGVHAGNPSWHGQHNRRSGARDGEIRCARHTRAYQDGFACPRLPSAIAALEPANRRAVPPSPPTALSGSRAFFSHCIVHHEHASVTRRPCSRLVSIGSAWSGASDERSRGSDGGASERLYDVYGRSSSQLPVGVRRWLHYCQYGNGWRSARTTSQQSAL